MVLKDHLSAGLHFSGNTKFDLTFLATPPPPAGKYVCGSKTAPKMGLFRANGNTLK